MYATLGHDMPTGGDWTFEPKYDGMRVVAETSSRSARLLTRNGNDKARQFPEIASALRTAATQAGGSLVLDGEIVARPRTRTRSAATSGFQQLQARMHVGESAEILRLVDAAPAQFTIFDVLRTGRVSWLAKPWTARREHLEALFAAIAPSDALSLGDTSRQGASMMTRARRAGWEGVIAKRTSAPYQPGARSRDWIKLKLQFRAEFVVGGFTDPRRSRPYLGALLLGAHDAAGKLQYVGRAGGGLTHGQLRDLRAILDQLPRATSPFATVPRATEPVHWVSPRLIVEVKFAEWTADGLLRQPIVLGVRDDKAARDVTLEGVSAQRWRTGELKR